MVQISEKVKDLFEKLGEALGYEVKREVYVPLMFKYGSIKKKNIKERAKIDIV